MKSHMRHLCVIMCGLNLLGDTSARPDQLSYKMRALKPFTSLVYSACVRQRASQQLASTAVYLSTASTGELG